MEDKDDSSFLKQNVVDSGMIRLAIPHCIRDEPDRPEAAKCDSAKACR